MGGEEERGVGVFGSEADHYCVEDVGEGQGSVCEEGCGEFPLGRAELSDKRFQDECVELVVIRITFYVGYD